MYEVVLDDLDRAEAALEHRIRKLAKAAEERVRSEDQPVFCRRGHFIGVGPDAPWFCDDCGAASVTACTSCEALLTVRGEPPRPPAFCGSCGAPFPWVDRQGRLYQLQNLLDRENLDSAAAIAVREELEALAAPGLSEDEQRERWERIRNLAPGLWKSGRTILEGVVGAAIKAQLGL